MKHNYKLFLKWDGNRGNGTADYKSYDRTYTVQIENKEVLYGSADPAFRGDKTKYNPEDMLLAALSSCHMMSYLHVCAVGGVVVLDYSDNAVGEMITTSDGAGHFTSVALHPMVVVAEESMIEKANSYHEKANKLCFIANSVNFPVIHKAIATTSIAK